MKENLETGLFFDLLFFGWDVITCYFSVTPFFLLYISDKQIIELWFLQLQPAFFSCNFEPQTENQVCKGATENKQESASEVTLTITHQICPHKYS